MLADNGSAWFISGAPDSRWDNTDLHNLVSITGTAFEAVDVSPLMIDPNSGQALQNGISVTVTPSSANLAPNAQQQFHATVNGSSNQSVNWGVNGSPGGNSTVGFIDSISGLYTAPNVAPGNPTVTIQATSQTTPAVTGTASVTITGAPPPVSVTISPKSVTVRINKTQQFTASVQNASNQSVTWKVSGGGNISSSGLYKAPSSVPSGSVTVTAVSAQDNTKSASAAVTITRR
jgi:hypothetical protein